METQHNDVHLGQGVETPVALRESRVMRSVNRKLRELAGTFAYADLIAFFCECRTASCYSPIPMSVEAFDAAVTGQTRWLLRAGHEPSTHTETSGV
jgi:hypothetical protein